MLVKVDRASMHWALEARVPLLDPRIVEWAWAQPAGELIAGGTGKVALRRVLSRYVPDSLTAGPKRGFDPPLAEWLRGPLRPWAAERLAPDVLAATGWLDPAPITEVWREHQGGTVNHDYRLWTVLSFVTWLDRWAR
jgi:asparagine synthase (glutamine-hydrolysing)